MLLKLLCLCFALQCAAGVALRSTEYTDAQRAEQLHKLYKMGLIDWTEYRHALSKFHLYDLSAFGISDSAARRPEYVDEALLAKADHLREAYAKTNHVPAQGRAKVAAAASEAGAVLVLDADDQAVRPNQATGLEFRQESNFMYTTGFDYPRARVIIGLDPSNTDLPLGHAWLFVEKRNPVWTGLEVTLADYLAKYDVNDVFWLEDFDSVLNQRLRPAVVRKLSDVQSVLNDVRSVKFADELELIRLATEVAGESHKALMTYVTCGMWESDSESLFRYVSHNYGMRFQAYIPIVGAGENSAALHYNDGESQLPEGGVVLVDAAPEVGQTRNGGGYTSDITRTWPCSGTYSPEQRGVYNAVYRSQNMCIERAVVGGSFSTATQDSALALLEGLLEANLVHNGTASEMYAAGIQRLFQPHGLGHSVGLDVHDPGNLTPFKAGHVITCEPGCYFYPTLLTPAFNNPNQARFLNRDLLESPVYWNMGGIRIEDIIVVTDDGPVNYSDRIPRSADEIEAFMRNARKTPGNRYASQ